MNKNDEHLANGVDGDADALWLEVSGIGLGATTETKMFSQELEKRENKAVLSFCLVKRKLLKNIIQIN
jgi:hypothetical protein